MKPTQLTGVAGVYLSEADDAQSKGDYTLEANKLLETISKGEEANLYLRKRIVEAYIRDGRPLAALPHVYVIRASGERDAINEMTGLLESKLEGTNTPASITDKNLVKTEHLCQLTLALFKGDSPEEKEKKAKVYVKLAGVYGSLELYYSMIQTLEHVEQGTKEYGEAQCLIGLAYLKRYDVEKAKRYFLQSTLQLPNETVFAIIDKFIKPMTDKLLGERVKQMKADLVKLFSLKTKISLSVNDRMV